VVRVRVDRVAKRVTSGSFMKDEITKQNVITRRSVLAMFSTGLAGAACYPFAGMTGESEPKDPESDKWTVAFGESKAVTLLKIASAVEPIDSWEDPVTREIQHRRFTASITLTINGTMDDAGLNFDSVGRPIKVTMNLNGETSVVSDSMCVGIYCKGTRDEPRTTDITMTRNANYS